MKGLQFRYVRHEDEKTGQYSLVFAAPPYSQDRDKIFGRHLQQMGVVIPVVAAIMHDFYSVSAEEQRRMVENTIALCEMKYAEQEVNNV